LIGQELEKLIMNPSWIRAFWVILLAGGLSACSAEDPSSAPIAPETVEKNAESHQKDVGIVVSKGWARPTLTPTQPGGAYFSVTNHTKTDDRLFEVSSSQATRTEMHDNVHEGDVVRMVHLPELSIPAGATVQFAPGGKHVMMFGLDAPLKSGDSVPLTLSFEHVGEVAISVTVSEGMAPPSMQHHDAH
jgi:copper(I)-binding protein